MRMHSDLKVKFHFAQEKGLSMVAWRMPYEEALNMLEPAEETLWQGESSESPAFVFAPFSADLPAFCIGQVGTVNQEISAPRLPKSYDGEHYKDLVKRAVSGIQEGSFHKIVAARAIEIIDPNFNALDHFYRLIDAHPNAFCYAWYSPSTGLWLGASPELLMDRTGAKIRTMALAGTRSENQGEFGSKEIEEQDLVLNYLEDTLRPFVTSLEIDKKTNAQSGHLTHLKNEISGHLKTTIESIYPLIQALHPTPAVAGLPKEKAIDFIAKEEGFSRSYYTGYLGIHSITNSRLFVNLRCMQVLGDRHYVYVGAGLTGKSDPEAEWLETEEKARIVRLD